MSTIANRYSARSLQTARNLIRSGMDNGAESLDVAIAVFILTVETTPEPPADVDDDTFAEWNEVVFLAEELRLGIADPALIAPTV